jgi:hypothetical protein
VQVDADVHQHEFYRDRVLVRMEERLVGGEEFVAVGAAFLYFFGEEGDGFIPKGVLVK